MPYEEPAYAFPADFVRAFRRAEGAHVEHPEAHGALPPLPPVGFHRSAQDENWPAWYADYMVAEQARDGPADLTGFALAEAVRGAAARCNEATPNGSSVSGG